MSRTLPRFSKPPLVETLLSVQFAPLSGLRMVDFGLFWLDVKEEFPIVEERQPIAPAFERFDTQGYHVAPIQWQIGGNLPLPRVWYRSPTTLENGQGGIQLQRDRFIHGWARTRPGAAEYPTYTKNRANFVKYFKKFEDHIRKHGLGQLAINQCEVTYVNQIPISHEAGAVHAAARRCFPQLSGDRASSFQPQADRITYTAAFPIQNNLGRLHVLIHGPLETPDARNIIEFRLTARGMPAERGPDQALAWLDLGHEWIVNGFYDLTSPDMHGEWEYVDEHQ